MSVPTVNTNRFADGPANNDGAAIAAQKAQEIAAKLSQTLTGSSTGQAWQTSLNNVGGSDSITMDIPVAKIGLVIGRSGSTIREIQDTSGARLQLDSAGEPTRILRISGSAQGVEIAKAKVQALLDKPTFGSKAPLGPPKTMQIPSEVVGFVIGKGGETIKRLSHETGCRLQIENEEQAREAGHNPPMPGHQHLHLVGSQEAVISAERAVKELLERKQSGNIGRTGYGPQHQQSYIMRAQPYPTYVPNQGYAQFAQQAYTLPSNAISGYPGQMQGYGCYPPQSGLTGYPAQINPQQVQFGYAQPFQSNISQPSQSYQFQNQQPTHDVQQLGYSPNQTVSQYPPQGCPADIQKQGVGVTLQQQGLGIPQSDIQEQGIGIIQQRPGLGEPQSKNHQQGMGVTQQQQGIDAAQNTIPMAPVGMQHAVQPTNAVAIPNTQQILHASGSQPPVNHSQNINQQVDQAQYLTGSQ